MVARWFIACCVAACAPPPVPASRQGAMKIGVPAGAWQRDWISRHGGARDASVTVRYVQTPSMFGDVRIRGDRPALAGAASFADLSDDQLLALAKQNGFAGTTTVDGANATWHHEVDFQPSGESADIGRIELSGHGKMFEHALDESYVESWSALGGGDGPFLAVRVARGDRVDHVLAVAGDHFVYARARVTALPAADSITDAIATTHAARATIIGFLDCEISYGNTRGWHIVHSTLPWQEGKRLAFIDRIGIDARDRPVATAAEAREAWSFPVNTFTAADLRALFPATR